MKLLFIVVAALLCCGTAANHALSEQEYTVLFSQYVQQFSKSYVTPRAREQAFASFKQAQDLIIANRMDTSATYRLGWTAFTDMSWEEFQQTHLDTVHIPQDCSATTPFRQRAPAVKKLPIPRAFNWRTFGVVAPVVDQGSCGSCYAFSSTAALESAFAVKHRRLIKGSEEEVVECLNGKFNNHGCKGGLPSYVFNGIKALGGMVTEESYPYTSGNGTSGDCKMDPSQVFVKVIGEYNVTQADEQDLVNRLLLAKPVSVAFDVVSDFMHYTGGVYKSTTCKNGTQNLNHAVLLTGYGEVLHPDGSVECYYEVKNSWSTSWGLDGYFWIQRDCSTTSEEDNGATTKYVNMCGIATCASYPIVL